MMDAIQCRTCGTFETWPDERGPVTVWAVQHSRATGHPDSYHMIQVAPVPPADAYVSVDMRWRLVRAKDMVIGPDRLPWMVNLVWEVYSHGIGAELQSGDTIVRRPDHAKPPFDPDATVRVLVPWPEAAGIVMLREGLGPVRVLDRGEVA